MSILREDTGFPAGPYAEGDWLSLEHPDDYDRYRDEDYWGKGCDACVHEWIKALSCCTPPHQPSPYREGLDVFDESDVFGFPSKTALFKWFQHEWRDLDRFGYIVREYDVPDNFVEIGRRQLLFNSLEADRGPDYALSEIVPAWAL